MPCMFLAFISLRRIRKVSFVCTTHPLPRIRPCLHARASVASCDLSPAVAPKQTNHERMRTRWALSFLDVTERNHSSYECGCGAHSFIPSSAAVDSPSLIWALARTHARQSPVNRMHCKINVEPQLSVSLFFFSVTLHGAQRTSNVPGSIGQTLVSRSPVRFSSFCYASSFRQTEANSPWDIRTWNILFTPPLAAAAAAAVTVTVAAAVRSANVPLPAASSSSAAPSLRGGSAARARVSRAGRVPSRPCLLSCRCHN